jgi:hypothetical protein
MKIKEASEVSHVSLPLWNLDYLCLDGVIKNMP